MFISRQVVRTHVRLLHVVAVTGAILLIIGLPPMVAAQAPLTGENARDIDRVTRTTIEQANSIRLTATVESVRLLMPQLKLTPDDPLDQLMAWHLLSLNVTAIDHSPAADSTSAYHEQYGPHRTSRALAIVHLAVFEVVNGFAPAQAHYASYLDAALGKKAVPAPPASASEAAAIIEAAYYALIGLYPGQQASLQQQHDAAIKLLTAKPADVTSGRQYGAGLANQVLSLRNNDGAQLPEPRWGVDFVPRRGLTNGSYPAGQWQIDPVSLIGVALGGNWPKVKPFVMSAANEYRNTLPGPPALSDAKYKAAYKEVYEEGGDPKLNTVRKNDPNLDHYYQAKFWSYDATAGLCAPVRLYNQIGDQVLQDYKANIAPDAADGKDHIAGAAEVGRYYALINIGMADAAIAAWDAKYYYQFWRPVTGIRFEQAQSAGNNRVEQWFPLGAQQTNSINVINITPPFPSYPSGHAVFGGALFEILRDLIPNDHGFSFQSDEFNGDGRPTDSQGKRQPNIDVYNFIRCTDGDKSPLFCKPYKFASFHEAETDNALSRLWMGVHWRFDAEDGDDLGERVGDLVYSSVLKPGN